MQVMAIRQYYVATSVRSSMDRASDFGSEGWRFESVRARHGYATYVHDDPTVQI